MKIPKCLAVAGFVVVTGFAAEKKITMKELPEPVQAAVREQTKSAELVGLSKEVEGGKTLYEVETKVSGKSRDLLVDSAGKVVEVEEEVAMDTVPAAAKAAIEQKAKGAKVVKVESVTKGSSVSYEATLSRNGKKSEVAVTADGKIR